MQQTTLTLLDSYCERGPHSGPFAEPLNASTNLLFIVAAILAWRQLKQRGNTSFRRVGDLWLLIAALFCIGVGSTLWHVFANQQTMLADVLPITVFINVYLISALRRQLRVNWPLALACWSLYAGASVAAQMMLSPGTLNGSIMYLPAYAALVALTAAILMRDISIGIDYIGVVLVFSISLIFRTVDLWVCPMFPIGTHFLWHILNAWVIYRLLSLLIARARTAL